MYVEVAARGISENLTSNIIATLQVAREIEACYRESLSRATRDRSRAVLKSRLRNAYRKVEITLNSNSVGGGSIGEAEGIYRRWRRRCGAGREGTRSGAGGGGGEGGSHPRKPTTRK